MRDRETYQKLVLTRFGDDFRSCVEVVEEPIPDPGPDEIVIRNLYAGVNAGRDILACRNAIRGPFAPKLPHDMGVEAAGEVARVGRAVKGFKVGDPVVATKIGNGYREYCWIPAGLAVRVREASPQVLTLLPSGQSAAVALYECGEMKSGEVVLVTAAAGAAGHIAVQLARLAGNHVIGTCGSPEKTALLREIGCDRIINYRAESVREVLGREYPEGVHLALDGVGGEMFEVCVDHLANLGRLVVFGFMSEYQTGAEMVLQPRFYHRLFWKSATVRGCSVPRHYAQHIPQRQQMVLNLYDAGQLKAFVDPAPFDGIASIASAVEYHLGGKNCGKVVVRL
jgi:hypothetical protein